MYIHSTKSVLSIVIIRSCQSICTLAIEVTVGLLAGRAHIQAHVISGVIEIATIIAGSAKALHCSLIALRVTCYKLGGQENTV